MNVDDYTKNLLDLHTKAMSAEVPTAIKWLQILEGYKMEKELIEFLSDKLDVSESIITTSSHLIDDLGSDRFTIIDLVIDICLLYTSDAADE